MLVEPGDSQSLLVELQKKKAQRTGQVFPAGHCLKNPEDKAKAGGRIYILILPNHFIVFGVVETLVLLQFFPDFFFFFNTWKRYTMYTHQFRS